VGGANVILRFSVRVVSFVLLAVGSWLSVESRWPMADSQEPMPIPPSRSAFCVLPTAFFFAHAHRNL
jgi:hypothetical protein